MKYTHLIWDFNGTLFDDVEAGILSVNTLLRARGLRELGDVEEYRNVFGFPVIEYYEKIGFDFSKESFDAVAHEWLALYLVHSRCSCLSAGAREIIEMASAYKIKQLVLSASEREMLCGQLRELGIYESFCEIIGIDNIYAGSKISLARRWREENPDARALFVGDTLHDYDTAQAAGADCLLYSGGHHSREKLLTVGCPVIDELGEIVNFLS